MKPLIIDNLLPSVYQNELENTISHLPFYYTDSIGYDENSPKTEGYKFLDNIGFSHALILDGKIESQYWNVFKPILYFFTDKTGISIKDILRVRLRLTVQHPNRKDYLFNKPHTDLMGHKGPYKTLVYYINDSDGNTYIFDKFLNRKEDLKETLKNIDQHIILKQKPKKGTGIYFEGHQYHSGNTPINYKSRYVINFDFTI
tara:strand:- start:1518 stop:2120 length:603 start_codon:yes stop_codon:yes gene_type:complete